VKVCILEKPGTIAIAERPVPTPGPGDLLVRVRAALTCGTDLKAYRRGHPKMPCPTPFGHEFSGEIAAVGADVARFRTGDAVMSANTGPCGRCFFCVRDEENLCESLTDEMILGAYAEYVLVPARVARVNVYRKPEGLPFDHAALLEPLSSVCFGLQHLPASALREDATVLVIGAGPIALLWLLALKASGTCRVVVAGRRAAKLGVAAALGADRTLGENDDVLEHLRADTGGRGADAVIECTGMPEVWQKAPEYARRGGTVVLFGGCAPGTSVTLDTYRMHYDGVRVASPFHFRPRDVAEAFRLLGTRRDISWAKLVTSHAGLDDVPRVFERLGDGSEIKCAIVPGEGA
jgi:L-iditol 2-dehydrogenase